jgi:hypothetical protein
MRVDQPFGGCCGREERARDVKTSVVGVVFNDMVFSGERFS